MIQKGMRADVVMRLGALIVGSSECEQIFRRHLIPEKVEQQVRPFAMVLHAQWKKLHRLGMFVVELQSNVLPEIGVRRDFWMSNGGGIVIRQCKPRFAEKVVNRTGDGGEGALS